MRVFVIGGTGFISGRMVEMLLGRGHDVTIFTRGRSRRDFGGATGGGRYDGREPEGRGSDGYGSGDSSGGRLEQVTGDRRRADSMREAVRGRTFDAVVDMIAYDGDDSRAAVDAVRDHTGRFIHCSTISVYMISDAPTCPITEDQDDHPVMDDWPRNPFGMGYGLGKRACEDVLWEAHDRGDFAGTALRPTFVSGPEDKTARDFFWIQRILDGRPLLVPGSGDHAFQQVYVDDAARAFADAVEEDAAAGKAYNVVGEDIYSLNDYIRRTAALLDRDVDLVHCDQSLFDELPFSTHPRGDVFPFNTQRTAVFSLDRIKKDLDYVSTRFETWMRATIDWYLDLFDGDSLGYDRRDDEIDVTAVIREAKRDLTETLRQS